MTATATTRQIQGGVAGVIQLVGRSCSLHIADGPTALVDPAGRTLGVTSVPIPTVNPPDNVRPDLALAAGKAWWGFTWTGSWCGARAAAVVVPMSDGSYDGQPVHSYGDLSAPITGPQPSCHGASDAFLEPGVPGDPAETGGTGEPAEPAQPVLSPPPGWSDLRLSLTVAAMTSATAVPASAAALVNPTDHAIALSPCPEYAVEVSAVDVGGGGSTDGGRVEAFPCTSATVVPAHGSLPFTIPGQAFDQGLPHPYASGSPVTIEVAIAGVPTAKALAHIG